MHLLFERLSRDKPENTVRTLRSAVQDQVQRIVTSLTINEVSDDPNIMNFGIPSVVDMANSSEEQLSYWALRLRELIRQFEPRLKLESVDLQRTGNIYAPLKVMVTGQLDIDDNIDTMQFSIDLSPY